MKNLPFAVAIPIVAIAVVLGIAVILRIVGSKNLPVSTLKLPAGYESSQSPTDGGFGTTITDTEKSTTGDLETELESTVDDGGLSEFSELEKAAAGL